jgi:hypothetical protein
MKRLVELAERDVAEARDNLARAQAASHRCDVNAQWGQSGRTLAQLITDYQNWEREALQALNEALGMEAKRERESSEAIDEALRMEPQP